jgi:uncharacterized protein YciI
MQFMLQCFDRPHSLALRLETRPRHLDYVDRSGVKILLAGPMLSEAGDPVGSLFLLEADDIDAVRRFSAADPYTEAGLFDRIDIRGFRTVFPR